IETTDPASVIAELEQSGDFRGVALERYAKPFALPNPNDPYYRNGTQYALGDAQGSGAWVSASSVGARFNLAWPLVGAGPAAQAPVAVIDTALPANPSAQLAAVVGKYDVADNDADVRLPAGINALDAIHGGYVASVIAARGNDGTSITGAAWDSPVYFYKVLEDGRAASGSYLLAISDITVAVRRAVADGAKVINMSFGSSCPAKANWATDPLAMAINDAVKAGVTVVAAAGNDGNGTVNCPASFPGVISVAAADRHGLEATFSEFNAYVDITAPGEDIAAVSAAGANAAAEVKLVDGTSFSSPLVAAAAALIKRTYPALTPALIERCLIYTAQDAGAYGRDDRYGYGMLDAAAALTGAKQASSLTDPYTKVRPHVQQMVLSPSLTGAGAGQLLVTDSTSDALGGKAGAVKAKLLAFPATTAGVLSAAVRIGYGWTAHTLYAPGDWNGDGKADLMARDSSGRLLLYPGLGDNSVGAARQIGSGWSGYTAVPTADLSGDGKRDILAIQNSTGKLYLYRGDGKGGFLSGRTQVGSGWAGFKLYAPGDLTGDGRNDIVSIASDGSLYQYPGTGKGGFSARAKIGHGWNVYRLVVMGRFDYDSNVDIIALDPSNWRLYYYRGLGHSRFSNRSAIASGW
ncbi:MAG: S8 family serine peptidase, partial [Bifidobacteriaceae bacterium]|nr:S8 family serine peptidase [Bifidobacteriaceae bacterium]